MDIMSFAIGKQEIGKQELRRLVKVVSTFTFEPQKVSENLQRSLHLFLDMAEDELKVTQEAVVTPASNAGTAGAPDKALAFADGEWHPDVKAQMDVLEKTGKLKEADLDQGALKALKTLPYEVVFRVCARSPKRRGQSPT